MKNKLMIFLMLLSLGSNAQSITELIYPQYIQGVGSGNAADDRKVPYACRMKVSGLLENTTYRGYNKFVTDPTLTDNGQGNYIIVNPSTGVFSRVTSASLASAGRYIEFTTDVTGSYTGWFISEPTIATSHFQPGTQIYFRLMLNDGLGGSFVNTRVTATNPVTVLGFGSAPTAGTGVRAIAAAAFLPKNFIMLYNNITGTGRPVAGTFIENDATEESVANGYAPFYANNVDAVNNTWGTIIPNNLATGINNITQYSLANAGTVGTCTSVNGVYGTTNTSNASGGLTELVLNPNCSTLPVTLLSFTGNSSADRKDALLRWTTASEINFSSFIVEKSKNGVEFAPIGNRASKGDNSVYNFTDILTPGISYYRLKLMDTDGRYSYSDIVAITKNSEHAEMIISPNPVRNMITISHSRAKAGAKFQIYSIHGQLLTSQAASANGIQTKLNVENLNAGQFILQYRNGDEIYNTRFEKF
jgi:hypothetical protein